jgi:AraC-like DNA-binding protein
MRPYNSLDPLSDVLSLLKLGSSLTSRTETSGRWALRFPPHASDIKFGAVLAGRLQLVIEGEAPMVLEQGDFYLLTNGRPFVSASVPAGTLQDGPLAFRDHRGADGVVRFVGEAAADAQDVVLASSGFTFERALKDLLLRHLPPLVHLRGADPASRPLMGLLDLLAWEMASTRPGTAVARESLATLVLVQALRVYLETVRQPEGWLRALGDRRLSLALAALHGDVARRWTVEGLAGIAGMSRTAFSVHFREVVGTSPLDYLTAWRMTLARRALSEGSEPIAAIADRVGYQSETAFSAAFRRASGESPGRFRSAAGPS